MTDTRRIPEWLVERVAQRELTNHDVSSEDLSRIAASNEEILARYPVSDVVSKIKRRVPSAPIKKQTWLYVLAPVAAALVLALSIGLGNNEANLNQPNQTDLEEVRPKGLAPKLQVYRQRGDAAERLAPRSRARARDLLQLTYISAGKPFGVIVSVDGRGAVTRHLPDDGGDAAKLSGKGEVKLDESYELDDAPRFECFYFVTSDKPFSMDVIMSAAKVAAQNPGAALVLPEGLVQSSILLEKDIQ